MAFQKRNQKPQDQPSLQPDPKDPKVVETEDKVENNEENQAHDMGDVVARDSAAHDGVKQSP